MASFRERPSGCIFCDNRSLTKEHIWPDWLRKVLHRSIVSGHHYSTSGFGRKRTFTSRTGNIESRKLRIVCNRCNNGWMSRLQNNAKPRLIPLIQGQHISLTEADHKVMAAWSMMFTMVLEFLDLTTLATTQRERLEFSQIPAPNNTWMGWFGISDDWPPWHFYHYGWLVARRDAAVDAILSPIPSTVSPRCTSQTTTIRVGKLLVHTYSTRRPGIEVDPALFAIKHGLHLIWPLPASPGLNASPLRRLTQEQVIDVAWDLIRRGDPRSPKPTWPPHPYPPPA